MIMGKNCFVPGCKTGYNSTNRKSAITGYKKPSVFRAPNDPDDLKKWNQAIARADRKITENDYVCELHFSEDCIMRSFETKLFDGKTHELERGRPSLKKGSVPSFFPNASRYLKSHTRNQRKTPQCFASRLKKMEDTKPDTNETIDEGELAMKEFNFNSLVQNLNHIKVPSKWWCINLVVKYIAFVCWDENCNVLKKIIVDSNLNVKVFNREKLINMKNIKICSVSDLTSLMQVVDELNMCKNIQPRFSKDPEKMKLKASSNSAKRERIDSCGNKSDSELSKNYCANPLIKEEPTDELNDKEGYLANELSSEQQQEDDDDLQFFRAFVPFIKYLPHTKKMNIQRKIQEVIYEELYGPELEES